MRVRHRRHGDQEMVREIGGRSSITWTHGRNCKLRPLGAQSAPSAPLDRGAALAPSAYSSSCLRDFLVLDDELLLQIGRRLLVVRQLHRPRAVAARHRFQPRGITFELGERRESR
jgi:hypothetical protein